MNSNRRWSQEHASMATRLRTAWIAGPAALILVILVSGAAFGATVLTAVAPIADEQGPLPVDTIATFEDADGDGIDDDCDEQVAADPIAAAAAAEAVDLDHDGKVSVSEAARSNRVGGENCNHGGYVSQVAHAQADACEAGDSDDGDTGDTGDTGAGGPGPGGDWSTGLPATFDDGDVDQTADAASTTECADDDDDADDEAGDPAACDEVAAPVYDPAQFSGPGGFGRYVSSVAQSDAVGGKNCNHGGAVSEAVKAAKEAAREAPDAAKAERAAERAAEKAQRAAERAAKKAERAAERAAAKAARQGAHEKPSKGDD
jgi:hypothetical protein